MKWNILLGSLVLTSGMCAQGFSFELLDRMLGVSGCCSSSCCEASCGAAAACDSGCAADPGCGARQGGGGARRTPRRGGVHR